MRRLMFLTTASAILALAAGAATARAAEGEHGPAHAGGEGVHAAPMKSGEHVAPHKGPWVAPKEIPHEGGVSIFGGTEHRPDGWRYKYENGGWWYWMPNKHWTYYDKGAWQDYSADPTSTVEVPVPSDPNYYWYKNQWWYLRGDHWSYYDHDHWHEGAPGMGPPRREGGHGEVKHDEHPPRFEGPEGKKK